MAKREGRFKFDDALEPVDRKGPVAKLDLGQTQVEQGRALFGFQAECRLESRFCVGMAFHAEQ